MSIATNYGILQHQIADELGNRTDLLSPLSGSGLTLSPIQNAIQSAIAIWEREPFYFNELYDQSLFNTVAGQEFYTSADAAIIATAPNIVKLRVLINSNRYTLTPRTWQYLEDVSVNPSVQSEFPVDWAYFAETIRLYPIPDQAIPVTGTISTRFTNLSADADSNAWTEDAFDLIRSQAKLIIANEVIFDDDLASRMKTAIYGDVSMMGSRQMTRGYLYALQAETSRRANGRIRPSYF